MVSAKYSVLLYDGACALCNWWVRFVVKRDHRDAFRFASLQSRLAAQVLLRHGVSAQILDSVYVVLHIDQATERLLARSDALIHVLREVGAIGKYAATACSILPRPIRDALYNTVARNRYRIFGKYDSCPIPSPEIRSKFLDL